MTKLFKYELMRLLLNKLFLGLLLTVLFLSWQVFSTDVILGVCNTAPFSCWSFGYYLSRVLPFLLISVLFFVSFFCSNHERKVSVLTKATPLDPAKYLLIRCGVIAIGYLLLSLCVIALYMIFCVKLFYFTSLGDFLLPALLTLIPAMLLIVGLGLTLGKIHPLLIYLIMFIILLLGYLPIPYWADLMDIHFFAGYPAELGILDPPFAIPSSILIGKGIYSLIGLTLIITTAKRKI